jgi:predicted nucleotidyltransferase
VVDLLRLSFTILATIRDVNKQLQALGFVRDRRQEHRWFAAGGVVLDILPVTHQDIARAQLTWPESGYVMSLVAFDLLLHHTRPFALELASIPTLVVLKMAAWLENPHERDRDVQDIGFILSEYLSDEHERRWADPALGYREHRTGAPRRARPEVSGTAFGRGVLRVRAHGCSG